MIDRNARARLGAKLRADSSLTHATRLVGHAALFAGMDARTGRCQVHRARLAHEAGCCERTISRATADLEAAGYLTVVPTWGPRRRQQDGRWFRPRGANVLEWRFPADFFLSDKLSPDPSPFLKKEALAPLPDGLARALERLGNAMADRKGPPKVPIPT